MSFYYSSDSLNDIHKVLMMTLHDDYDFTSAPRGKKIKELVAPTFTLTDPRNRIITSPERAVNYGFAVGELCWYLRGDTDLETMLYYNKRMGQFSDDGKTINSAYGARIFNGYGHGTIAPSPSQFENVVQELKNDSDSRRAIMHINQPHDLKKAVEVGSKDVPCTLSIQLLIRDRKLHMHVLMRSNDVVWGLPYDVFSFTCLQEAFLYVLQKNGVSVDGLGSYHHTAGSLHIYETHFEMAEKVSKEPDDRVLPMEPFTPEGLEWLAHSAEPLVRASAVKYSIEWGSIPHNPESANLIDFGRDTPETSVEWMVGKLVDHRDKRVIERRKKGLDELTKITEEMGGYEELNKEKDEQQT